MSGILLKPIGVIRSPFAELKGMPIQPVGAKGVTGRIEVYDEYRPGLEDLDGFSHIFAIYHLHLCDGYCLHVKPFLDNKRHGIFATRSPKRPNSIGLSVLEVIGVENGVVHVANVDILDNTPILDIKPYVPKFDVWPTGRIGWFAGKADNAETYKADTRFAGANTDPEDRTANPDSPA